MSCDELIQTLRRGALEWNTWRAEHPRLRVDLRGADLQGFELDPEASGIRLDLTGALLREANLSRAALCNVELTGADLRSADLRSADLRFSVLNDADLSRASLRYANLSGTRLCSARLLGTEFRDCTVELLSDLKSTGTE